MAASLKIVRQPKQVSGFVEDINGVSLDMILIPPGTFTMGAAETEEGSSDDERPQHEVRVSTFFMGRYPVTQAQWQAVAAMPQEKLPLKPNPSRFKGKNRPVEQVSWYEAIEFCARLSRHTGRNYRLPSEAEWEYAARGGTTTPFHFGETISTDFANYDGIDEKYGAYGRGSRGEDRGETTDVDYFEVANGFGLSDIHGNVWEWCLDPWHENYQGAPSDGRVWNEVNQNIYYQYIRENLDTLLKNDQYHLIRGGSWFNSPVYCRCVYRYSFHPDSHYYDLGFRVACGVP